MNFRKPAILAAATSVIAIGAASADTSQALVALDSDSDESM